MSETMGALYGALAKAQAEMKNAALNKTNPHFRSRYADLATIRDAITAPLAKHGLCVAQVIEHGERGPALVTILGHTSGAAIESRHPLPPMGKPQEFGSALTYARRYALAAMCGIGAEEDDDANAANDAAPARPSAASQKAATPPPAVELWCNAMAAKIKLAKSPDELAALDADNSKALEKLTKQDPDRAKAIRAAFTARANELAKEAA